MASRCGSDFLAYIFFAKTHIQIFVEIYWVLFS
jgi:hypothetical protein